MTPDRPTLPRDLRRRAEELLATEASTGSPSTTEEMRLLAHDLAVHQVELEIQNEELQSAYQRIDAALGQQARLYHQAPVGLLTLDRNGILLKCNQTFLDMLGSATPAFTGTSLAYLLETPGREIFLARYQAFFHAPQGKHLEATLRRRDGSPLDIRLTGRPELEDSGGSGSSGHLLVAVADVSAEKRAEQSLRNSERRHRLLLEAMVEGVVLHDAEGRILDANPAAEGILGLPRTTLVGQEPVPREWEAIQEDGSRLSAEEHPAMLCVREGKPIRNAVLGLRSRGGGGETWILMGAQSVPPDLFSNARVVTTFIDITERKNEERARRILESEVNHLQRLESVGRLAGGVAHEMNNILGAIMSVSTLLLRRNGPDSRQIELILEATRRGRDVVKKLVDFARKDMASSTSLDLNRLIRSEAELLASTTLKKIDLLMDLEDGLPWIQGEASELSNVLMNLCVNAIDSMPDGGSLCIRTRAGGTDTVELLVEDSGAGMSKEVLSQAMEPFFTTKPPGKGTGLGLAMVYGTVRAHGGSINLESTPGRGTRVTIRLPGVIQSAGVEGLAHAPPGGGGSEPLGILLIDDDPLIRESGSLILGSLGHHVTVACGGEAALDLVVDGLETELIILDLNMPTMDGLATLRALRPLRPSLPIFIASGFIDEEIRARLTDHGPVSFLSKPYSVEEFQAALKAVGLHSRPAASPS